MQAKLKSIRKSVNWGGRVKRLNLLVVMALVLSLLAPFTMVPAPVSADNDPPKADPELLRLAAEHPDDIFMVIIQREVKHKDLPDDAPETEVTKAGGKVKKQLKLIESFSAELTGKKIIKLATKKKVRWISFDAPLFSTALPGFGTTGKVSTAIGSGNDTGNATALQSDGKIVVAGFSLTGAYSDFALVRYNSDGSLDTSFGTGGKVTTAVGTFDDMAYAVALQSDGKIVVAGQATTRQTNVNPDFALVRYNSNGSLDTTFNTTGKVITGIGTSTDKVSSILIQPDGKIVLVGYYYVSASNDDFALVRYNANGSLDTTFGASGIVTTAFGTYRDRAYAAVLQADGKILAAGFASNSSQVGDFALARYNSNGSLDTTLDGDGKATTDINSKNDTGNAVALQADGKIVVAGAAETVTNIYDLAVARYNSNGSLDTAFGSSGKVVTGFGGDTDYGRAVAMQPNGKIVVAGDGKNELNNYALGAVRLLSNGSLDTTFDVDGKTTTWVGSGTNFGNATLIQTDGKIVVAGVGFNGTNNDFAVVRYNTDGGLDCTQCIDTGNLVNVYNRAIGADRLWNGSAHLQGQGVTVAVVDSGINAHSDLQVSGAGNSRIITATSLITSTTTADGYGHGTHVAGLIGGNGATSNGARLGVAPGVNLINVKVANDQGMSLASDLVHGLEWIYNNRAAYNIKVVNISMNSAVAESYQTSPIDAAVEILWFNGITVVVAAGNNGGGVLYPPANDPFVITVGAMDDKGTVTVDDDEVAAFSAYGTTENGFSKPDLVAPGRNIISLLASTGARVYIDHVPYRVDTNLFRMSGTSMSAPMVSGAVALLLQDEPNLNPDQVKYRLTATANKTWPGYNATKAGAGYLDAYAAVNGTTTQTSNTGIAVSNLLTTGSDPISWGTVQWGSVQWGSVQWGSVQWGSVQWGSVQWGSDYWGP